MEPGVSRGEKGLLIVLSGPAGVGKGAVRARLKERRPDILYGVSATTRPRRPGETDGVSYFFLDASEFQRRVAAGEFVEWAEVHGNLYGTPRRPMEDWLAAGKDVIVEKDIQGAATLRKRYPDAVYVFLLPPTFEALRERMERRGSDPPAAVARRLEAALAELEQVVNYDYAIVNDDLDETVRRLEAVILAEKCRVARQPALTRWAARGCAAALSARKGE